ncbi:MAG: cytidine deaminase [Acidobacteriota bacterium]
MKVESKEAEKQPDDRADRADQVEQESRKPLVAIAREVRERAHAPYSGFKVGAAVEASDGTVFTGCNVENSSYGLSLCAERVAVFKAISEGRHDLVRVAVIADSHSPVRPCGACRQVLSDILGGDAEVIMANLQGAIEVKKVRDLLPTPFDRSFL